jgi:hypothetical protein
MNEATKVPRPLLSMCAIQARFRTICLVSFSKPRTIRLSSSDSSPKTIRPRHRTTAMPLVLEMSKSSDMVGHGLSCGALSPDNSTAAQYKPKRVGPFPVEGKASQNLLVKSAYYLKPGLPPREQRSSLPTAEAWVAFSRFATPRNSSAIPPRERGPRTNRISRYAGLASQSYFGQREQQLD